MPIYSDWYRNKQLMRNWKMLKTMWALIQGTLFLVVFALIIIATGFQH